MLGMPGRERSDAVMAKRTFDHGGGGRFVQVDRDSDDERLQFRAAKRLGDRAGTVELVVERDDGTYRNLGSVDWEGFKNLDDLFDYIDDIFDNDGGGSDYYGGFAGTVSVVAR